MGYGVDGSGLKYWREKRRGWGRSVIVQVRVGVKEVCEVKIGRRVDSKKC